MKINTEEWNPQFVERLKKYEEAIDYMEGMYGIGIEEWDTTMNPLHYLDALHNFYQLKQADVSQQREQLVAFAQWLYEKGYANIPNTMIAEYTLNATNCG